MRATYIRGITEEELKVGYRPGEIVRLENEEEIWVRSDLCSVDYNKIVGV